MRKICGYYLLVGALALQACTLLGVATPGPSQPPPALVTPTVILQERLTSSPDGLSPDQVRNAAYRLGLPDQIRTVQLSNGHYQEGTPGSVDFISVSVTDFIAFGDLTGDGEDDAAALVTENYGGTGIFVFLAIFQNQSGVPVFYTSIFLDDRPTLNALSIEGNRIFVDTIIHNFEDPLCCPTVSTKRHYLLNGIHLVMIDYATQTPAGDARVITIDAPQNGEVVSGIVQIHGKISIAPFENNLIYRIYDMGGVELSAGPVTVEAPELGAPGVFNETIDLGTILTNTTIRVEIQDVNAADGSLFAMDSVILRTR